MKTIATLRRSVLIATLLGFLSAMAAAQEKKISAKEMPAPVIAAFKTAYPGASIRGYSREKENGRTYYEIESREGQVSRDVLYNPDGTVAEIEETIDPNDLPAEVRQAVQSRYPKGVIAKAEKTVAGDKVSYEVRIRQGIKRVTIELDPNGQLLHDK
jgi:uncharacterized membrane protein YkoI